jgi:hypothetical protein
MRWDQQGCRKTAGATASLSFVFQNTSLQKRKRCLSFRNMSFDLRNDAPPDAMDHPLLKMPRDDLDLIAELVLRSGSLKDLADAYGVSYPTIRVRLDKVIERLSAIVKGKQPDPLSELLAKLVERGELSASNARAVRELSRKMARRDAKDRPSD